MTRAKDNASKRTKDRLRQHNLAIAIDRQPEWIRNFGECRLFRCVDHCGWVGWLPIRELDND